MKKDYENPDIVEEDPENIQNVGIKDKETWKKGRNEEEKRIGVTEPYPKKTPDEIEKEIDKKIMGVMKDVQDPELGIDIWSLGLIYDVKENNKENDNLDITMTFTSPMCPYGPQIVSELKSGLKEKGFKEESINIDVVFNPLWEPSEELKEALGMGG